MPIPNAKADGTCSVCRVVLGDPRYYTRDPDARRTSEREEIYAWLRELACPRDDPVHTQTSMFDGRSWNTEGQARARCHNAMEADELDHMRQARS